MEASIERLEDYIEKRMYQEQHWQNEDQHNDNNRKNKKWEEKQRYGQFKRLISDITHEKKWMWLRKRNHERETESLRIAPKKSHKEQSY